MIDFFKDHLDATWVLAIVIPFLFVFETSGIAFIVLSMLRILAFLWILDQKDRSYVWVLFSIAIPLLENKNECYVTNATDR